MIKTEFYRTREDGVDLYKIYSDKGVMIHCIEDGGMYEKTVNVLNHGFTFEETDQLIPEEIEAPEAINILFGRIPYEEG